MSDKENKTFGIKFSNMERKNHYQDAYEQARVTSSMTSEQYFEDTHNIANQVRKRLALMEENEDLGLIFSLINRAADQLVATATKQKELKEKHAEEVNLWKIQCSKLVEEKARAEEAWEAQLQVERGNADKIRTESEQLMEKAQAALKDTSLAQQWVTDERRHLHDIFEGQQRLNEQLRYENESLRREKNELCERMTAVEMVTKERDEALKALDEYKGLAERALEKARAEVREEYLRKWESRLESEADRSSTNLEVLPAGSVSRTRRKVARQEDTGNAETM